MGESGERMEEIRLEIGAGDNPRSGYIHLDSRKLPGIEIVANADKIPLDNELCKEIYAANILEHFSWRKTEDVLKEWFRILSKGGRIELYVPDFDNLRQMENIEKALWFIYGDQDYDDNYHKAGFTFDSLKSKMLNVGFENIKRLHCIDNWALHIEGYK